MALTAFCPTCERTVYIEEETTPVCPVCSTPLLDTTQENEPAGEEEESAAESGSAKG
jgi:uncharacterized Zn finger protein (UPF0148 family)